jgi:hypothetical protein
LNIESIARELIDIKARFDTVESEYTRQRDKMHNALDAQPDHTYSWNGFRFTRVDAANVISVNKESVISALRDAGLPQSVVEQILSSALIERERGSSLRISETQA